MSERERRLTGTILILGSIMLCLIPAAVFHPSKETACRSRRLEIQAIEPLGQESTGIIRINDAEPDELTGLPGIGETLAALIVEEREINGPYYFPEDLEAVKGIGAHKLSQFRGMIDFSTTESEEQNGIPCAVP